MLETRYAGPVRLIHGVTLALLLAACASPPNGGTDARAPALDCVPPLSIVLVPSPYPANRGIPMAGIAWTGDHCALETDERHPDLVLLVADFTGTVFGDAPVATRVGDWSIVSSSLGTGPATYLAPVPRDTDVAVHLERGDERIELTFRLEGDTLVLVSMRLV